MTRSALKICFLPSPIFGSGTFLYKDTFLSSMQIHSARIFYDCFLLVDRVCRTSVGFVFLLSLWFCTCFTPVNVRAIDVGFDLGG